MNLERLKAKRLQTTCYCFAYSFPHQIGGGRCSNASMQPPFCLVCGHGEVDYHIEDTGAGKLECHGQTFIDKQPTAISNCCQAEVASTLEAYKSAIAEERKWLATLRTKSRKPPLTPISKKEPHEYPNA